MSKFKAFMCKLVVILILFQIIPVNTIIKGDTTSFDGAIKAIAATNSPTSLVTATPTNTSTPTKASTATPTNTPTPTKAPTTTPTSTPTMAPSPSAYIKIDFDKTTANVGDIIKAEVKVSKITNLAGDQINLKYDPTVLQPVKTGTYAPYAKGTNPDPGNLLVNPNYSPFSASANNVAAGILNFGGSYLDLEMYKADGYTENTGTLAVILFKVLASSRTNIAFVESSNMPGCPNGVTLFDVNKNTKSGYTVIQPPAINPSAPTPTPTMMSAMAAILKSPSVSSYALTALAASPAGPTPTPINYSISGYVKPEVTPANSNFPNTLAGFKVEIQGENILTTTGLDGSFTLSGVSNPNATVKISKGNYLTRLITLANVKKNFQLGTASVPVEIWAGDIDLDSALNMADIMQIAGAFNSISGDTRYKIECDLDGDNAINMTDIMLIARHFNAIPSTYPLVTTQVPNAPTNLKVDSKTNTSVSLVWDSSNDATITGYNVYMGNTLVGSTDSNITKFTVDNLAICSTNNFTVETFNYVNTKSPRSGSINVTLDLSLDSDMTLNSGLVITNSTIKLNNYALRINGNLTQQGGIIDLSLGVLDVNGSVIQEAGTMAIHYGKFNILGSLTQKGGIIDLGLGTFDVKGDIVQEAGMLDVNSGKLIVGRDYRITTELDGVSSGTLSMINSQGYVTINGNFTTYSNIDHSTYLTSGIMEIKGNFVQKSNGNINCKNNFTTSGAHRVILNGNNAQSITFENIDTSKFNILEINKPLDCYTRNTIPPATQSAKISYGALMAAPIGTSTNAWDKLVEGYKDVCKLGQSGVDSTTGNFSATYTDLVVKCPGMDMVFTRTYNSLDNNDTGMFGRGWRFGYEGKLEKPFFSTIFGYIKITMPNGSVLYFKDIGNGMDYQADGNRNTLTKTIEAGTDVYILTTPSQYQYGFRMSGATGELVWIKDRNGNKINISYVLGRIDSVTDTVGRTYKLDYYQNGRLKTITAPGERIVTYTYNLDSNLLETVSDPNNSMYLYFAYDSSKYLWKVKDYKSDYLAPNITISYDHENGHRVRETFGEGEKKSTVYSYDDTKGVTQKIEFDKYGLTGVPVSKSVTNTSMLEFSNFYDIASNDNHSSVAICGGDIFTSLDDGATWENTNNNHVYNAVKWGNGKFIALSWEGYIISSKDGKVWSDLYSNSNYRFTSLFWDGQKFFAYFITKNIQIPNGMRAGVLTSVDGGSWSLHESQYPIYNVDRNKNIYVGIGEKNKIYASCDGISWINVYSEDTPSQDYINKVIYCDNKFIAYGTLYNMYSFNGIQWSNKEYNSAGEDIHGIAWNGMTLFGVGYWYGFGVFPDSYAFASIDQYGTQWANLTTNGSVTRLYSIGVVNENLIALGYYKDQSSNYSAVIVNYKPRSKSRKTTYQYDGNNNITQIIDSEGRVSSIQYKLDEYGRNLYGDVKTSTDRNNATTQYDRDGRGNVTKITNPDNSYIERGYDEKNNLMYEIDEELNATVYVYDTDHINLKKKAQSLKKLAVDEVSALKTAAQTQDLSSYLTTDAAKPEPLYAVTVYEYYPDGYYKYDQTVASPTFKIKGLLRTVTDPEQKKIEYSYTSDGYLNYEITYEDSGVRSAKKTIYTYTPGKLSAYMGLPDSVISPEGRRVDFEYDKNGLCIRQKQYDGATLKGTSRVEYDAFGRKTKEVSPKYYDISKDDLTNNTSYDASNTLTNYYKYTYYNTSLGKLQSVRDPGGNTTSYTYDVFGNVLTETKPNGSIYSYEFDSLNRVTKTYFQETSGDARVLISENQYEILENEPNLNLPYYRTRITKIDYIKDNKKLITRTTYDYAGRVVEQQTNNDPAVITSYYRNGKVQSVTDAKKKTTKYFYDKLNLLTETRVPYCTLSNGVISYSKQYVDYYKNGLLKSEKTTINKPDEIVEKTNCTEYSYNSRNQLTKVKQIDNSSGTKKNLFTQYFYDADGHKVRMYTGLSKELTINGLDNVATTGDADYSTTKYDYNYLGKLSRVTFNPSVGGSSFVESYDTYDLNGNLTQMTDRNGYKIVYDYDSLNRLTLKKVTYDHDPSKNAEYSYMYWYDTNNKATMNNGGTSVTYNYDKMGRLETETWSNNITKSYKYYGNSSCRETMTILQGGTTKVKTAFDYDDNMRLYHVYDENNQLVATYKYDVNGNRESLEYNNNISTDYKYNDANKLETITNENGTTVISKYTYTYYLNGNQASKQDNISNKITYYEYDDFGRLTSETESGSTTNSTYSYLYDDFSNRTQMKVGGDK